MKTRAIRASEINRSWHLLDAENQILGRLSTKIAGILIGKNKVNYSPNLDSGDYVVVVNAGKLAVSGRKALQKIYYRHSGYPGGFKETRLEEQMIKDPRQVIRMSVSGMLPKNKLRDPRLSRLKIFPGGEHPYGNKFKNKDGK